MSFRSQFPNTGMSLFLACRRVGRLRLTRLASILWARTGVFGQKLQFLGKTTFLGKARRTCLLATGKNSAAPKRTFSSALVSVEWRAQRENDRREERGILARHSKRIVGPT